MPERKEVRKMKHLTIKNGELFLDEEKIENLKSYKIVSSATSAGIAELTVCIDVSTVSTSTESKQ